MAQQKPRKPAESHTAQVHSLVLSRSRPLQVIFENLGGANDDIILPDRVGEGDLELRDSADSLHFVGGLQEWQELCGVVLLYKRNLGGTEEHRFTMELPQTLWGGVGFGSGRGR